MSFTKRGIASPQPDVMTDPRQMHAERRAPASCSENADGAHQESLAPCDAGPAAARKPTRRSTPVRSRVRLVRCLNTISAAATVAAVTVALELPARYAIGGKASAASTDPSEMYLRDGNGGGEKRQRGRQRERRQHRERPRCGGHPLPPRNRSQTG